MWYHYSIIHKVVIFCTVFSKSVFDKFFHVVSFHNRLPLPFRNVVLFCCTYLTKIKSYCQHFFKKIFNKKMHKKPHGYLCILYNILALDKRGYFMGFFKKQNRCSPFPRQPPLQKLFCFRNTGNVIFLFFFTIQFKNTYTHLLCSNDRFLKPQ